MSELKPCPFCGGKAWTHPTYKVHAEKTRYVVKCTKCNAIMEYRSQKAVEEAWNRRADKTFKKYLDIPMRDNDANAKTIGEYLETLLLALWEEKDDFSGKRPFGNSGWEYELFAALIAAGCVDGEFDEDGYIDSVDYDTADAIIRETISGIFDPEG